MGDVFATMRDGVRLGADVYLPSGLGPAPAILIRQPYGKRTDDMGMDVVGGFFARKGYACVVQDVRGKFSSGGEFDPASMRSRTGTTRSSGPPTQEWCNGRVGLWGESYYGITSLRRGDQRPSGDRLHRARRHRRRPPGGVVPAGRLPAEHDRLLGDRDGRQGVHRRRPASIPTGCRWPTCRRRRGGRARSSASSSPTLTTATGGPATGCADRLADVRVPGAVVGRLVRLLHRAAAGRLPAADGAAPASGARPPDDRPVGPRGLGRVHRPRGVHASCRRPRSSAGTATRRSSTAT